MALKWVSFIGYDTEVIVKKKVMHSRSLYKIMHLWCPFPSGLHMPSLFLMTSNATLYSGFVMMSIGWCLESTNSALISPFPTCFLMKWWCISICFSLECIAGILVRLIALVLSHSMIDHELSSLKSLRCCYIHRIWAQQISSVTFQFQL